MIALTLPASAQCWVKISAGYGHTAGIKTDGTLWVWGNNGDGQLGDGTTVKKNTPKQVGNASNWLEVTAGYNQTFAIKSDGTLWAWGENEYWQLGDGTTTNRLVPTQIGTDTNWVKVAVGFNHGVAKKANGTIWAWGANFSGELGDGTFETRTTPVQIGADSNWNTIECGQGHTLATKTNGTLWAWGINGNGQLGDGTITSRNVPVQIGTGTNWVNAAGGEYHSIGLKADGSIWCWGSNSDGQIGVGTPVAYTATPAQVGTDNMWKEIDAGKNHTLAIGVAGDLWAWGDNSWSQLTSSLDENLPRRVGTSQQWEKIAGGGAHTVSITNPIVVENGEWVTLEGVLKTFGANNSGQLGNGNYTYSPLILTIACPTSVLGNDDFEATAGLKLYPNPMKDVLTVSSDATISTVTLYNLLGQEVAAQTINANEASLNVSGLSAGTYIVKVMAGHQVKTLKVTK